MINFDNSATSFPKPEAVRAAADSAFTRFGGNPGRGGHRLSLITSERIFTVRERAAQMFGAQTENVIFTPNCTASLNFAIKGIMQHGGHIIISAFEHNSVLRPVYALYRSQKITFSVARIYDDDDMTVEGIRRLIRSDTKCVCCMTASNVTGKIMPYKKIAQLCRLHGLCFISDAAQAAGSIDLKMSDGFNFLCMAGHKALYGPSGTGLLISDGEYELSTIIEGGNGSSSELAEQSGPLPERLESGTLNTPGILGLGEGLDFVRQKGTARLRSYEEELCKAFEQEAGGIDGIRFYSCKNRVPIVSFNIGDIPSQVVSAKLSEKGYALRGGLHCSALAHRSLGTLSQGTVRFSPGAFNNIKQVRGLVAALHQI